jgi:hypothetical protein
VYTGPITVAASETLKAIAVVADSANGWLADRKATRQSASPVSSAAYIITTQTVVPTFSPAAGTYSSAQTVNIQASTPSATIYYTTNGSTPTTSSPIYASPITVAATETLKAIEVVATSSAKSNARNAISYVTSQVGTAAYVVDLPTFSAAVTPAPVSMAP